jgi:hypothetical protein
MTLTGWGKLDELLKFGLPDWWAFCFYIILCMGIK